MFIITNINNDEKYELTTSKKLFISLYIFGLFPIGGYYENDIVGILFSFHFSWVTILGQGGWVTG